VVSLIDDDPVRTPGAQANCLNTCDQPRKVVGPIGSRYADEIYNHIHLRFIQRLFDFSYRGRVLLGSARADGN
jgi:hypothetical protein